MTQIENNRENKSIKPDKSWTLFLDRDGVINKRLINNYVKNVKEFEFIDGVLDGFGKLSNIFGKIIIVTNQQGIGKGLMTGHDLDEIHFYMCNEIKKAGGRIDKIYYCTDLANSGSKNRKPAIGMGMKAKKEFPEIEFEKSIMVGDTISDMIFGKELGMINVFLSGDNNNNFCMEKEWDLRFKSLKEFADWIIL